jgi:hydroxymethylpyrimidine pyrophosphatase-like HAD family hydrolase
LITKKIIFFDATGTLWYPKTTRNNNDPGWVYRDAKTKATVHEHLIMLPTAKTTLKRLNRMGVRCVIVSAVPYPLYKSKAQLEKTIKHFGVGGLIWEYHTVNMVDGSSKAKLIERLLKKLKIKKNEALMVGDGYWPDYKFVRKRRIQALLMDSKYQNSRAWQIRKAKHRIYKLSEIIKFL